MELFLPSIAALLVTALLVFLVLPRLGAPILSVLALVLLAYGVYTHYYMFYSEYRYSTWQERLKFYAPFMMIAGLILAIVFYLGFLFSTGSIEELPATNVPGLNTGAVAVANNAVVNASKSVNTAMINLGNTLGLNNTKKNNVGILTNLGNILNTPTNKRNNILL